MTTIAERTNFPTVLLIEDNHGDAILVQRAFKKAKIPGNVTIARTAEIGLSVLRREGGFARSPYPDLILLDVDLPYMSAHEFLKTIKEDPDLRLIPAIVMGTSKSEVDLHNSYEAYASGFVIKPFVPSEYDHLIKVIEDYWFQLNETPKVEPALPSQAQSHESATPQ